jgi:hypothetical protein
MTVEITEFVDVSIAVSPTGVAGGNFGILGFLTNEDGIIGTAERGRPYTSLASVGDDWSAGSEVFKAAQHFYAQTPTPKDFTVLMAFTEAQEATVNGGGHQILEDLVLITAGSTDITIDATAITITSTLDFSAAVTLADVAAVLEAALAAEVVGTTVVHNGVQFVVKGAAVGVAGTITHAEGDVGAALGLSQAQGSISQGIEIETPVAGLAACVSAGIPFVGLVTHKRWRDKSALADGENTADIAVWAEAAKKIFCNTTNNLGTLSPVVTTDIASQLKDMTLRFSLTTFSKSISQYPSAAVFGRAASVNFSSTNSTITLNLKQLATLTAEDLTPGEYAAMQAKYCSAVIQIGTSVNAYTDSRMASGTWLDTTHGILWLENRCEVDLFNLLYTTNTKIPYTQSGLNVCSNTLNASLRAAVVNGLAAPGYLADGTYLDEGFVIESIPLADVPSSDLGNRIYKGLSFKMKGAGALHTLEVAGSFTE